MPLEVFLYVCGTQQWHLPQMAKRVLFVSVCAVETSRVQDIQGKAFWLLKKWRKKKSESTLVTKTCLKPSFLMLTKWNVPFLDYSQSPFKVNKNDLCFPSLLFPCNVSAGIAFLVSTIWMLMNVRASKEFVGFTIYFATCLNLRFSNSFNTPLFILEHKRTFVAWA